MNAKWPAILGGFVLALTSTLAVTPASADGRQLSGRFCTNPQAMPKPGACIQLSFEGQTAQGYTGSQNRVLVLRPGTYWLSVNDNSTAHNFSLENPGGSDQDITTVPGTPGWVTIKINLTHGTWVLFCEPHRAMGMYVDIEVGGVGQIENSFRQDAGQQGSLPGRASYACTLDRNRTVAA